MFTIFWDLDDSGHLYASRQAGAAETARETPPEGAASAIPRGRPAARELSCTVEHATRNRLPT